MRPEHFNCALVVLYSSQLVEYETLLVQHMAK